MPFTPRKKATGGIALLGLAGLAAGLLRRWRRRSKLTTWAELASQLDAADVPHTLTGLAAMRGTSQTAALRWLRSQGGELNETAKVLADTGLMRQLAEAEVDDAEVDDAAVVSLDELRRNLGRRSS